MDVEDFYGFTTNNSTWLQFFTSAGCYSVEKDANDMPKITFGTEKNVTVLQSIVTYLNDPGTTLLAERITGWPYSAPKGGANLRATIPNESFTEGRSLLTADLVGNLTYFREMKMDFGVVPAPKFDEAQKDYTIYIHQGQASTTQIPLTVAGDRLKLVSAVIEQSMYESYQTIKPVLYDQILGARDIRDAESADCLNIILSSGRLDVGCAYNLAIDSPIRTNVATNDTNIVSVIETNKAKNDTNLQKLIDNLQKQVDLQKAKK